ncbi:hypothetical protein PMIT1303_02198 [Prochlorococcus sp. MIT 1303]|nr:hypothetical protein [Prochlorococcus sp. MIT 1303]KZR61995.1 hypothetical protein PMIT1303_02198 [Prochlorococcus sp. MIT 1303]
MEYSEKIGWVVTSLDTQKVLVVRAPELLLQVWFEDMTFVHVGDSSRCGCANEGHGTIHILLMLVVLPKLSVALIRRVPRHRRSLLMAAFVFGAFACRQSAGRPMAERVANQACCRVCADASPTQHES